MCLCVCWCVSREFTIVVDLPRVCDVLLCYSYAKLWTIKLTAYGRLYT